MTRWQAINIIEVKLTNQNLQMVHKSVLVGWNTLELKSRGKAEVTGKSGIAESESDESIDGILRVGNYQKSSASHETPHAQANVESQHYQSEEHHHSQGDDLEINEDETNTIVTRANTRRWGNVLEE